MADYTIVDLAPAGEAAIQQAALILLTASAGHSPAWPDMDAALREVREACEPGRLARIAITPEGRALGWIGGIEQYDGHVWELHPLMVAPAWQGRGIGRALVQDFEEQVRQRGCVTVFLGTDDEDNRTSLSGIDLYDDLWGHIRQIRNLHGHPYEFYHKMGYAIVGVIPDANGPGKPDILMAKRVGMGD